MRCRGRACIAGWTTDPPPKEGLALGRFLVTQCGLSCCWLDPHHRVSNLTWICRPSNSADVYLSDGVDGLMHQQAMKRRAGWSPIAHGRASAEDAPRAHRVPRSIKEGSTPGQVRQRDKQQQQQHTNNRQQPSSEFDLLGRHPSIPSRQTAPVCHRLAYASASTPSGFRLPLHMALFFCCVVPQANTPFPAHPTSTSPPISLLEVGSYTESCSSRDGQRQHQEAPLLRSNDSRCAGAAGSLFLLAPPVLMTGAERRNLNCKWGV